MLNSQQLHHHQQHQPPSSIQINNNNNNNNLLTTNTTTIIADNIITTDNLGNSVGGGGGAGVGGGGGGGGVVGTGGGNNTNSGSGYFIFDKISSALQERSQQNDYELSTTQPTTTTHPNIALSSASSSSSSTSSAATASTATAVAMAMQSISKNFQQQHTHQQHQQQQHQSHQQQLQYHQQQHLHQHQHQQQQHLQHHQNSHQQQLQKCCYGGDTTYHFKTLVPSVAAGAIIGKGGETIAAIQKETGARVKMSKSHDFYPGTTERVCLITGSTEAIVTVVEFIMDKIREKPDLTTKSSEIETKQAQERDKQVKILVPNSTAGMIIGKAGAFIKQIKEESGSYIQISQKPKDMTLQERCITIIGDKDSNKAACKMILAKIVEDPQSGTCLNVSYSDVNGPVANFNPTGSPYAINQNSITASNASLNSAVSGSGGLLTNGAGINLSLNLGQSNTPNAAVTSQILEHIKMTMRSSGFSETATNEVCSALGILAKYGVLGVNLGVPHSNGAHAAALGYMGVNPLEQSVSGSGVFGAIGQVNMDSFMSPTTPQSRPSLERFDGPFEAFRHANTHATTPISLNNNTYGLATGGATAQAINAAAAAAAAQQALGNLNKSPPPSESGSKDTRNVEIPEIIVGAILGPNGRSLIEIQNMSGATVQISKKGMFAPGTRNRIVTITGPPNAITMAHILIEQKITEEESKRARQNPVAGIMP